jgi:hypothetical protein
MQYTIAEAAIKLEVSKNTVYNRLKGLQKDLKPFTRVVKGITYIDEEGIEIIRKAIYVEGEEIQGNEEVEADTVNPFHTLQEDYINSLKAEIEHLKTQLQVKDGQIQEQTELVKREQQLRLNEQQMSKQSLLLLEEHTKEIDEKLTRWRMEKEQPKEEKKSGFFKNIFSR